MITLSVLLLILGFVLGIRPLVQIGWILLVVALVLLVIGSIGVGGYSYGWY